MDYELSQLNNESKCPYGVEKNLKKTKKFLF